MWNGKISTSQRTVMLCSWVVKTGKVQFASKTVWSMSEHIRGSYDDALYKLTYTLLYYWSSTLLHSMTLFLIKQISCQLPLYMAEELSFWKWARDLDLGSGHTAYCRASVIGLYLHAKFHWNWQNISCTDGRTYVQTNIWDPLY